jgi:peptide/nickel transport system substrate-binding protein
MKKGLFWIVLSCLMVLSMILASCTTSSITTASTTISTFQTTTPTTSSITTAVISPTSSTTSAAITTSATTSSTGNWWDSLGTPQYGGTLTIRINADITNWDPYYSSSYMDIEAAWMEKTFVPIWTLNPSVFAYSITFVPPDYIAGSLVKSWEMSTPNTFVVHLRQGIYWQNMPPANGRQFVASDVVFHFDRLLGLGDGFTSPSPTNSSATTMKNLLSVTTTDNYTVVFNSNVANPEYNMEQIEGNGQAADIECPDIVQQYGNCNNWHNAIGTGPFILTDFVSSASAVLTKNHSYWGYDERYPQNQLPYVNTLNVLIIANQATAQAAVRAGKIDEIDGNTLQDAQSMKQTNPEILQIGIPTSHGMDVDPRNDVVPFNNLQVREAMQLAIDLPTIAQTYYNGSADPSPVALTSYYMTGWGFPYSKWPTSLQAQYAYNPTQAKQLLAAAGYPNGFSTDVVADNTADLLLLQIVQSYLAAINVTMSIRTMDHSSWTSYVSTNHAYDQMCYASLGMLGLGYTPFTQLLDFAKGNSTDWVLVNDPVFNAFQPAALADTNIDDIKQVVQAANQEVAQQHFVISLLQPVAFSFYQPWLKGYNGQNQSIYGTNGPKYLGFFTARFWINKN